MASAVRDFADWSMYPFRLMGQTMDVMTKTFLGVQTGWGGKPRTHNGDGEHSAQWIESSSSSSSREAGITPLNDLSGDDIKLVRSYIAFTKPGHEKTSDARTELVTWDTDRETYGGVAVGRYLRENRDIDDHDMRYLKPHIEVIDRWPKEAEETETITRRVETHHEKKVSH